MEKILFMRPARSRLLLCLLLWMATAMTAGAESYTVRFVKGTDRFNWDMRTEKNLSELVYTLSRERKRVEEGRLEIRLVALQNVVDRYDPDAQDLARAQAQALQAYLAETCELDDRTRFVIHIDARTDLDNRVIVELERVAPPAREQTIVSPPTEEQLEPFKRQKAARQAMENTDQHPQTKVATETTPVKPQNNFLLGGTGIGVKTNTLLLAGLQPDGSVYSPVLNAGAEVYFARRFSVQLSFAYALTYKKGGKDDVFELAVFEAEPRWWLRGDGSFRGLYAGVYGEYGTFDVRIAKELEDNCTGSFYGGGLSVGWLQPVWRGFFVEAGVQVGFRSDAVDVYSYTPGAAYKRLGTYTLNGFTLQGFSVAVGYRF
ncbi:DUF3575 domain-containing protein [Parabacteroides segnis]|uniref:DUF3575 domain-containing protein n=1 Tax=Parabacteroides segnis TaxID=2763058 RepID=UPI0035177317